MRLLFVAGLTALSFALTFAAACGRSESAPAPAVDASGDAGGTNDDSAGEEPDRDGVDGPTEPPPFADAGAPTLIPTKIRYVLVVVKENHTFDNYFTGFPGATSSAKAERSDGGTFKRPDAPDTRLAGDICHSNNCGKRAYAKGKLNGFDKNNAGDRPFVRYREDQIPNYWQYARNFVLADHMFSTTLGPSLPGHAVFWAGRSLSVENVKCTLPDGGECKDGLGCKSHPASTVLTYDPLTCARSEVRPCFDVPVLTDHLPAGFTWTNYGSPHALLVKSVADQPDYAKHFRKLGELVPDVEGGRLANLTIVHVLGSASEHPEQHPCNGENLSVEIVNAAMKLPQWKEMAIVITWDDWGGFYDSVAPPVTSCPNDEHFQAGFRVPAIVISPYAKKGFVLKTPTNQASVPRLVEELWGMPFMSERDPRAIDGKVGSLMEAFDFAQPPRDPLLLTPRATCPK
ncbi:MAG: alkaline phosphatase family protein [Labilithrix sp.]